MPMAQPEMGSLGYRSRLGARGSNNSSGFRSARAPTSENVNPNLGLGCTTRSPRLSTTSGAGTNSGKALVTLASSRRRGTFGADITNVGNIVGKADKLKPIKQVPPLTQHADPPIAVSPPAAVDSLTMEIEQLSLVGKKAETDIQDGGDYAGDITKQLFKEEANSMPRSDYMDHQPDLNTRMRMILMDWLVEVHMKYKLRPETLHLTINLVDRHLSKKQIVRKKLQLVGVVALFIASKFEEIDPPELHDCVYITDKAYTKEDVLSMECAMLTTLSFKIVVPTAAHFFELLQKANGCNSVHAKFAQYIIELGLLDYRLLQYTPSHAVSAALLLSNELLGHRPIWSQSMAQLSHHTEASLRSCVEVCRQLLEADRAGSGGELKAVHKKYSLKEHHSVATMRL